MKGNKHIVKEKFILIAFTLSIIFSSALLAETVIINNRTYEMIEGSWYQIENDNSYLVDTSVITVKYQDGVSLEEIEGFQEKQNVEVIRSNFLGFLDLRLSDGSDPIVVVQDFINSGLFEIAELNTIGEYNIIPNDDLFGLQWALYNTGQLGGMYDADIDATDAWDITTGDPAIIIGILDSGTDWTHVDLGRGTGSNDYQNIWLNPGEDAWSNPNDPTTGNHIDDDGNGWIDDWKGWDFDHNNNDSRGPYFHGTHVAGIVGAKTNNYEPSQNRYCGTAGIAGGWGSQGSRLMIVNVGDYGPQSEIIDDAIIYVLQNNLEYGGVKIITMSLQVGSSQAIDYALEYAHEVAGFFINCSVGNGNGGPVTYPANSQYVFGVSATDHNDNWATYSNKGPEVEVTAPGTYIVSTTLNQGWVAADGTSMASPHVAGVATLIWSVNPNLTNAQVEEIIRQTAEDKGTAGFDEYYGWGRINAHQAVLLALAYANKSSSYDATAHNNNHILERGFFGKLHEVFQSGGEIFYRRSGNNGSSWETTKRITTGNGSNNHPSIAAGNTGGTDVLCLVWQKKINSRWYDIMFSISSDMGTSWSTPEVVPGCSSVFISYWQSGEGYGPGPTPVVASFAGYGGPAGAFLLVYAAENGLHYRYSNSWYTGWIIPGNDIVPGSEGSDSKNWYPSLATYNSQDWNHGLYRVNLTYDNRFNNVYSQLFRYQNGSVSWANRVQVSSTGDNNRLSSIAVDYVGDRLAVWSGFNIVENHFTITFRKGFANGTWGTWQKEWYASGFNSLCPSVTYYNKGGPNPYGIDILWYTESTSPLILNKRYSGSDDVWIPVDPYIQVVSLNSSFPNLTHERQNSPLPLQIWTDQSSQPYSINYNTVFLLKGDSFSDGEIRRAAEIVDTSDNSYLRIELTEPIVTLANNEEIKIPFKLYNYLDTLELSTENVFDYLQTELVNMPNNAQSVTFKVNIIASQPDTLSDGTLNTDPQTPFRMINFGLLAKDDSSHILLNNIGNRLLNNLSGLHHYSREFTVNALLLRGKSLRVMPNINLVGLFNQDNLYFTLVNVSIEGDEIGKDSPETDENNIIPTEFSLEQNFPNPFNPSTQIKYSVVEDGLVTLKVYDVLGREVAVLVNEEKTAGTYTINFNASILSSGVYFYTISARDFHQTKKMILLR